MGYKLIVSKEAHTDVDDVVTHIAQELNNVQAAARFLDNLETSYRRIADNPFMYALCEDARLQEKGYRKVAVNNYLILYRVDEAENSAYVTRVVYGARDYAKLL